MRRDERECCREASANSRLHRGRAAPTGEGAGSRLRLRASGVPPFICGSTGGFFLDPKPCTMLEQARWETTEGDRDGVTLLGIWREFPPRTSGFTVGMITSWTVAVTSLSTPEGRFGSLPGIL